MSNPAGVFLGSISFFLAGTLVGIGFAVLRPEKVRRLARKLGLNDPNKEWFYRQTVQFHQRVDACVSSGAVLFIGDSFIQGMCVTEIVPGGINYGIGGDTTSGLLARLSKYSSVPRAKAIVLAIGDNDLRRGENDSVIVANYERILEMIPVHVPVLFCSLTPCDERAGGGPTNGKIAKLNGFVKNVCSSRANAHYIDLASALADGEGQLQQQYDDGDGTHLNGKGYRVCIEKLRESIGLLTAEGY